METELKCKVINKKELVDSMEKVYHYTKIRNGNINILESIVRNDALHFHSSFFRKYAKQDYQWIRKYSKGIVEDICKENNWVYDSDNLFLNPYFISFCIDKDSNYMWEHYADEGRGMKFILNKEVLKRIEHGDPDGHGNYLTSIETVLPCLYINQKDDLKKILLEKMHQPELDGWDEFDKLKFLVSSIKQAKPYEEEQEFRHIHLHNIVGHYYYNNGDPYYVDDNGPTDKNEFIDILFPHDMLLGIELGPKTTNNDLDYVRQHIINMGYDPRKVNVKPYKNKEQ